jgi:fructokinase
LRVKVAGPADDLKVIGVVGESLVDVFTDADGGLVERPGGSPFNVAVALARLDQDVRLFTAFGADERGADLVAHLRGEGVEVTRGRSTAPTSIAHASLDASGHATYEFDLTWDPRFGDDWPALNVLHFGSLGSVLPPGADEVAAATERYAGNALISYDPNWRGGVVDVEVRPVVEASAARADIVKLSSDDAAAIYPGTQPDDVAKQLLELGPVLVVITKGAAGAQAWTAKKSKQSAPVDAEVVDTIGAGDAFMAAMLSELADFDRERVANLSGRELELVVDFACFVAGKTCERVGADPPYLADLF